MIIIKDKQICLYLFWGVVTTLINITLYYVFAHQICLNVLLSTLFAWFITIVVAFFSNKENVFGSSNWTINVIRKEFASFIICRISTGFLELFIMYIFVDIIHLNDMIIKIFANIFIIIINFILNKFIVFRDRTK